MGHINMLIQNGILEILDLFDNPRCVDMDVKFIRFVFDALIVIWFKPLTTRQYFIRDKH